MNIKETTGDFLCSHGKNYSNTGQFFIYRIEDFKKAIHLPFSRRDFYKITLTNNAKGVLCYADKEIDIKRNALIFSNPMIPYSWEGLDRNEHGFFCLFTEGFVANNLKSNGLFNSTLFKVGGTPVLFPDQKSMDFLISIFEKMLEEAQSSYFNKDDLICSYIQIIMHESLKMEPPHHLYNLVPSSSSRISSLFFKLLEERFIIDSSKYTANLKNASEFAKQLSIHTNHLNKALKEITGKTTSEHINERIVREAKILLRQSDLDIAEVGYFLGFEHPSNFNIFFKKQTGFTPNNFRKQLVSIS